jgi:hypothetical protein
VLSGFPLSLIRGFFSSDFVTASLPFPSAFIGGFKTPRPPPPNQTAPPSATTSHQGLPLRDGPSFPAPFIRTKTRTKTGQVRLLTLGGIESGGWAGGPSFQGWGRERPTDEMKSSPSPATPRPHTRRPSPAEIPNHKFRQSRSTLPRIKKSQKNTHSKIFFWVPDQPLGLRFFSQKITTTLVMFYWWSTGKRPKPDRTQRSPDK